MMPLILANKGENNLVKKLCGNGKTINRLEELGLIPGTEIMLVSTLGSSVIVNVKGSRIAISEDLAKKVMI